MTFSEAPAPVYKQVGDGKMGERIDRGPTWIMVWAAVATIGWFGGMWLLDHFHVFVR